MPTLLGVLESVARGNRVLTLTLVCSAQTAQEATNLADACRRIKGLAAVPTRSVATDPYDHVGVAGAIQNEIASHHLTNSGRIIVNNTGGTKLMALGASTIASQLQLDWWYVAMERESIIDAAGSVRPLDERIFSALPVEAVLQAHGVATTPCRYNPPCHQRTYDLIQKLQRWTKAEVKSLNDVLNNQSVRYSAVPRPWQVLQQWGWIRYHRDGADFVATRLPACPWSKAGTWLEEYVASEACRIAGVTDVCISTSGAIEGLGASPTNEQDVLFLYRGRLVVLECKAGDWDYDVVVVRDQLRRRWGGTFAQFGLIAANSRAAARRDPRGKLARAEQLRLLTITRDDLPDLRTKLEDYLRKAVVRP